MLIVDDYENTTTWHKLQSLGMARSSLKMADSSFFLELSKRKASFLRFAELSSK